MANTQQPDDMNFVGETDDPSLILYAIDFTISTSTDEAYVTSVRKEVVMRIREAVPEAIMCESRSSSKTGAQYPIFKHLPNLVCGLPAGAEMPTLQGEGVHFAVRKLPDAKSAGHGKWMIYSVDILTTDPTTSKELRAACKAIKTTIREAVPEAKIFSQTSFTEIFKITACGIHPHPVLTFKVPANITLPHLQGQGEIFSLRKTLFIKSETTLERAMEVVRRPTVLVAILLLLWLCSSEQMGGLIGLMVGLLFLSGYLVDLPDVSA